MERNGFPLSSMSALGTSLQFLIQVLSFLRVDMLGCVTIDGAPLHWTGFGGVKLRVFKLWFFFGEWASRIC
jgi:hypothetical protein